MGGAVSTGENNDDLVDNLIEAEYIKTLEVERVFRAVDRADYYLPDHRDSAYKDLAWKHGQLHLSAPCIYSEVMESLLLKPGQSFLNLGSGTGYLSTMAGLVLGPYGINHGVEIHAAVKEYAETKLAEFKNNSDSFDEFDFCEPKFVVGNCLQLPSGTPLYDRVYCGAACPPEHENYMKNLIGLDGILVMPLNDQLLQIRRVSETKWETKSVLPVSFATLISPPKEQMAETVNLPEVTLPNLQELCRVTIRQVLRNCIYKEHPTLLATQLKKKKKSKPKQGRQRRINIVPMSMGMMILGQFNGSDDSDDENHRPSQVHSEEMEEDKAEGDWSEDAEDDSDAVSIDDADDAGKMIEENSRATEADKASNHQQMENEKSSEFEESVGDMNCDCETSGEAVQDSVHKPYCDSSASAQVNGLQAAARELEVRVESMEDVESSRAMGSGSTEKAQTSSEESDGDNFDYDLVEMLRQKAVAMRSLSPPRKIRCSSSTSADTSETSGIGSLGDDPSDHSEKPSPVSSVEGATAAGPAPVSVKTDTVKHFLREKVEELPLPIALKSFVLHYRN